MNAHSAGLWAACLMLTALTAFLGMGALQPQSWTLRPAHAAYGSVLALFGAWAVWGVL